MWANRITIDYYIKHISARNQIRNFLDNINATDECISNLEISTDSGYVWYKITLFDKTTFTVSDCGTIL